MLVVLIVLLAGCSKAPPAAADWVPPTPEPDVEPPPAALGALRGIVVDETIRPILGAAVHMNPGNATMTTDAGGWFIANDLEPGFYTLSITAPGHLPTELVYEVVAGQIREPRIQLLIDHTPRPYHETTQFQGHTNVGAGIGAWLYDQFIGERIGIPACNECTFDWVVGADIAQIVIEPIWTDSIAPPAGYQTRYWLDIRNEDNYEGVYFASQDQYRADWPSLATHPEIFMRFYPDDFWPTLDQQYTLFATGFYLEAAPEDWTIFE